MSEVHTGTNEEAVSEPRLEEPVLISLVDVNMAAEDQLHVARVVQEHQKPGPNPNLHNRFLVIRYTFLQEVLEDVW